MPAHRKPARLKQWRGSWYIFWTDFTHYPPLERRVSCGERGEKARRKMLLDYLTDEKREHVDADRRGGAAAYDTRLIAGIDRYIKRLDQRVETRLANPEAREEGISASHRRNLGETLERFKTWLTETGRAMLTTGTLTSDVIEEYRARYASRGKRSKSTIAAEVRNLRCALRWLDSRTPPMFRDFGHTIAPALKPGKGAGIEGVAFTPSELQSFLRCALSRESDDFKLDVRRVKRGREENFKQAPAKSSGTPVSRLFILAALTGARLGELLAMKWEHVDFARGRITINASKTGRKRILPLIGAPEGNISTGLADLLKVWKLQAGAREYVLPHDGMDKPALPKSAWMLTVNDHKPKSRVTGPQKLRKNFTSYCASMGIPSDVAALWQGHSPQVAAEYYRQQVLEREQAASVEGAMGLDTIINTLIPASLSGRAASVA